MTLTYFFFFYILNVRKQKVFENSHKIPIVIIIIIFDNSMLTIVSADQETGLMYIRTVQGNLEQEKRHYSKSRKKNLI